MKWFKTRWSISYVLIAAVAVLTSCVADDMDEGYPGKITGKEVHVKFALQMPNANTSPATYAITEINENEVKTIDILAFKPVPVDAQHPSGFELAYVAQVSGSQIVSKPGYAKNEVKEFSVTLQQSADAQTFVILANVRAQVESLHPEGRMGADKDVLLQDPALVYSNAGSWNANNDNSDPANFTPFPMWGEVSQVVNDATTQITGVGIVRGIARLDVVLGTDVLTAANFKLDEVHIYNSKNKGQIVPAPANLASRTQVKAATLPAGNISQTTPLAYTVPASMNKLFERTIYLFEAKGTTEDKSSEATCVVVGGTYGTDTRTTYYRLDFLKKEATDTYFRDILRNHHYRMNIIKVSGRGYDTPDDAFNAKATNIEAEATDWNDGGIGDIIFNGQYALSVGPVEFNFSREAKSGNEGTNVLSIFTDYPTGWKIDKVVDAADGTTPVSWLSLSATSGAKDVKASPYLTFGENNTAHMRSANVIIAAGRMRYTVRVNQSLTVDMGLSIINPLNGQAITELVFVAAPDVAPAAQQFQVNFAPKAASLFVSVSPVGFNPPFAYQPGSSVIATAVVSGVNGRMSYHIQPAALTAADLSSNPFPERTSKIDYSVSNGAAYESKSIFLRQMVYNTLVDVADKYMLNGSSYSFTVRSNTTWAIKPGSLSDPDGILETLDMSQSGGYNTSILSPGNTINFKVVKAENGSKNGKTATLVLTDPSGKMTDVTFTIKGVVCGTNGIPIKQKIGNHEYLTHYYGTGADQRCWMVENSKEGIYSGTTNTSNENTVEGARGYYYTWDQANSACPDGWRLPVNAEFGTVKTETGSSKTGIGQWWNATSAFAGYYSGNSNKWESWGGHSYWWTGSDPYSYYSSFSMLAGPYVFISDDWYSVRCVQE
jgi:uncharacterized protein (TIGR02145 family)